MNRDQTRTNMCSGRYSFQLLYRRTSAPAAIRMMPKLNTPHASSIDHGRASWTVFANGLNPKNTSMLLTNEPYRPGTKRNRPRNAINPRPIIETG